MKKITALAFIIFLSFSKTYSQKAVQIVTDDIDNFWMAYDKIKTTENDSLQYHYLNELFLSKASKGQKDIMSRTFDFKPHTFIYAIKTYPKFWNSVRENTFQVKNLQHEIDAELIKLKTLYPALKPVTIYFTIGNLKTNSKTAYKSVLIGTEMAMADTSSVSSEFYGPYKEHWYTHFATNPKSYVVQLCIHEYIHTQQNSPGESLLSTCLYEGVAEFISVLSTGKPSPMPSVSYGKTNETRVKARFEKDMFLLHMDYDWLRSNALNEFKMEDLGYYIGYSICEKFYEAAADKKKAIKKMIQLNYKNDEEIEKFVDETHFFSASISVLRSKFNYQMPRVMSISEFENKNQEVDPNITRITINFSMPMDKEYHSIGYGPMGVECRPQIVKFMGFSEDGMSASVEVKFEPNHRYQLLVSNTFQSLSGVSMVPFLIDIMTAEK